MNYFFILFVLIQMLTINTGWSVVDESEFDVKVVPSSSQVTIKDLLTVTIDLTFPENYRIDKETLRQNILHSSNFYEHPFTVISMQAEDPKKTADGRLSQQLVIQLQPLRIGELSLTFYNIPFLPKDKNEKIHQVISPIFPIKVVALESPSSTQLHLAPLLTFSKTFPLELDEKNQDFLIALEKKERKINVQQLNQKRLPWIELGSVLLTLFVLWFFLKHPPSQPMLTAEQLKEREKKNALTALEQVKAKKLPERGFFDEFYVELTTPVRTYLEKKYHVPASTSTTPEFLEETTQNQAISSQTRQQLGQFLHQADKVKFGMYRPTLEECEKAQELAVQLVKSD